MSRGAILVMRARASTRRTICGVQTMSPYPDWPTSPSPLVELFGKERQ
jgi:hypothetical protein